MKFELNKNLFKIGEHYYFTEEDYCYVDVGDYFIDLDSKEVLICNKNYAGILNVYVTNYKKVFASTNDLIAKYKQIIFISKDEIYKYCKFNFEILKNYGWWIQNKEIKSDISKLTFFSSIYIDEFINENYNIKYIKVDNLELAKFKLKIKKVKLV